MTLCLEFMDTAPRDGTEIVGYMGRDIVVKGWYFINWSIVSKVWILNDEIVHPQVWVRGWVRDTDYADVGKILNDHPFYQ